MGDEKLKSLWGQDFRVVSEGLAETDVVIFVEKMMRQHRDSLKQLDHIAALHDLATKTVKDAEQLASDIKEQGRVEAEPESVKTVDEATAQAKEMLERAESAVKEHAEVAKSRIASLDEEYGRRAQERLAEIEAALQSLKEAAVHELATKMPTQYIGKHLYQSVHFLPAFENLIRQLESGFLPSRSERSETVDQEERPQGDSSENEG